MNKIGVIGATGMIGHHVAKAVLDNPENELVVLHRKTSNLSTIQDLKFESSITDLNDSDSLTKACAGLDYVLNCGAYYPTNPKPLKKEIKIAEHQMNNFVNAINESSVKKGLYLGGAIAIPKSKSGIGSEEIIYKNSPENKSAYVQVKWVMDKIAREAAKSETPIVIGIPTMTFGEFDYGPSTGRLITNIVNQTLPGYVDGNRNVVYAGDAARGLLLACLNGRIGERYLITGENISMENLVKKIVQTAKLPQMPKKVSIRLAKIVSKIKMAKYKMFGGELPLLNDTAIAVMSAGQFLNGEKAKRDLGYEPIVSIDESIQKTIDWFKKESYIK
ncbi:NAD-dependent epimerase/dehydratase family protein [uncultured Aquimarina sp.]|uniref:NAD-dependent epimerase/dehydratase family protein n=1 Tax=uncultured Aquimarina sp. TaxID=575652 RepID=UPI0026116E85|nr:NAD-dependent epimerase/dehydratase family protein [uncultured Aquimarina sp.]